MRRQQPCACSCGGQLWMVIRGFFGCGITEGVLRKQWDPGVMQFGGLWEVWVRWPMSLSWTQRRWWLLGSSVLMAWVCGDGGRRMMANAM